MSLKKITALLSAALLCFSLAACKGERIETQEIVPPTPIAAENLIDYTQDPTTLEHVETLQASFEGLAETDAAEFTMEEADGKLWVKSYNGTATAVRVPARVGEMAVVGVADGAFAKNETLEFLYLPDSITELGVGILAECRSLKSLRTPLLGKNAADESPYLGYLFFAPSEIYATATYLDNPIHLPASLKYLELGGMAAIPDYALYDCNKLECLRLSETVRTVGDFALYNCKSLLAINIEDLVEIGTYAFADCAALTRLTLGDALTEVGFGALEGCGAIRRMSLPFVGGSRTENGYLAYIFGASDPEFSKGYVPPYLAEIELTSATSLSDCAFYECHTLTAIKLPETLTEIGIRAFANCTRLQSLALPATLQTIKENAFFGCHSLKSVTFAESAVLSSVGINAFYNCVSLTEIALPQSLASLPASVFAGCKSLTTVDLGGVTSVGKNAFRNCDSLTSATAKDKIKIEKGNAVLKDLLK